MACLNLQQNSNIVLRSDAYKDSIAQVGPLKSKQGTEKLKIIAVIYWRAAL